MDQLPMRGTVVIGEGERDEAPMLYIGEEVGDGAADAPEIDIAVDPLEGTNLCANGLNDALAVVAMAEHGQFLNAPDTYMTIAAAMPMRRRVRTGSWRNASSSARIDGYRSSGSGRNPRSSSLRMNAGVRVRCAGSRTRPAFTASDRTVNDSDGNGRSP